MTTKTKPVCAVQLNAGEFELRVYDIRPKDMDPIRVYVEEGSGGGFGRVTVQCYASAWTAYWANHGEDSLESFFIQGHTDYLVNNLMWGVSSRLLKSESARMQVELGQIVAEIKRHFVEVAFPEGNIDVLSSVKAT